MEKAKTSKVIILWGSLIALFVIIIIFLLFQMSPRRGAQLVPSTEQSFPIATDAGIVEELSEPDSPSTPEVQVPPETETISENTPKEAPPVASKIPSPSLNIPPLKNVDQARLLETGERFWDIIPFKEHKGLDYPHWQTILIENQTKLDFTIFPKNPASKWDLLWEGKKLKIQFPEEKSDQKDILSRKKQGKYSVQMASIEEDRFSVAVGLTQKLIHDGYYAYLIKTETQYQKKYWYRVRVGFFKTTDEAQTIGQEIYYRYKDETDFPQNYWAVLPSSQELSKELIDLRAPINKPWVLELPYYSSAQNAIKDLPLFSAKTDFAYISQRWNTETKQVEYRTRIGFFETDEEAKKKLKALAPLHEAFARTQVVQMQTP
ncbi:SPOR domain-containing protein [Deltaproteobacteria bacterium TL4]